jgi:hypothetical protein
MKGGKKESLNSDRVSITVYFTETYQNTQIPGEDKKQLIPFVERRNHTNRKHTWQSPSCQCISREVSIHCASPGQWGKVYADHLL